MPIQEDSMAIVRDRLEALFPDIQFYYERAPGKMPCVTVSRLGGLPLASSQDLLIDSPLVDLNCYTTETDINQSYKMANHLQNGLKGKGARLNTGPVAVPSASEKAAVRVVNLSYVFYVD